MKRVLIWIMVFALFPVSAAFAADIGVTAATGTGYVYISGNAGIENYGNDVIIIAEDKSTGAVVYIDSCIVSEYGTYAKKFCIGEYDPSELEIRVSCNADDLTHTLEVMQSSRLININGSYNAQNKKIHIMINNIWDKQSSADFFVAAYDEAGKLLNVKIYNGSYTEDTDTQLLTFDYAAPSGTDSIKLMAWNELCLTPVAESSEKKYIDFSEFSERYTDEEIKQTADSLFSNLTDEDLSKRDIYNAYNNGDYKSSLILYRDYMVKVLRQTQYEPDSLQQSSSYGSEYYYGTADVVVGYTSLDELNNKFSNGAYETYKDYENVLEYIDTDEKSSVTWCIQKSTNTASLIQDSLRHLFLRLGIRYTQTGDCVYAKKLLQLMEDFADNYERQWDEYYGVSDMSYEERGNNMDAYGNEIYAYNNSGSNASTYLSLRTQRLNCFIYSLILACKALPAETSVQYSMGAYKDIYAKAFNSDVTKEGLKIIDPVRFAKIMTLLYEKELPTLVKSVLNKEGGTMNITADAYLNSMKLFGLFYGFRTYDGLDKELFAASETFFDNVIAEDGGFIETSFNYNEVTAEQIMNTSHVLEATNSYPQAKRYSEKMDKWNKLMTGYTSPLGLIPNIGNVYNNYGTVAFWKNEAAKAEQAAKLTEQEYTSVYYPYSGYGAMRSGWGIDDLYMSFFTNSERSIGHKFAGTNAVMNVTAYGRTLLLCGGVPWYTRDHASVYTDFLENGYNEINSYFSEKSSRKASTVLVNNKSQEEEYYRFDSNGKAVGVGMIKTEVREQPLYGRWLTDTYFDFCEGIYDNAYTVFDCETEIQPDISKSEGITKDAVHNRQFIFAKDAGAFIVVDNLKNERTEKNEYEALWHFPAYEENNSRLTGFKEEQVVCDAQNNRIYTCDEEGPNIFLYPMSRRNLEYKKYYGYFEKGKIGAGWSNGGSAAYDSTGRYVPRNEVHVKWSDLSGGEATQLLTLIVPSADTTEPVTKIENDSNAYTGTSKYIYDMKNDSKLYISSNIKCHSCDVSGCEVKAKTVIYTEKDGQIHGIMIDAERVDNKSVNGSYAFSAVNGKVIIERSIEIPQN